MAVVEELDPPVPRIGDIPEIGFEDCERQLVLNGIGPGGARRSPNSRSVAHHASKTPHKRLLKVLTEPQKPTKTYIHPLLGPKHIRREAQLLFLIPTPLAPSDHQIRAVRGVAHHHPVVPRVGDVDLQID